MLHVVMMTVVQPAMKVKFGESVEKPYLEEEEEEEGQKWGVDMVESLQIGEEKTALEVSGGAKGKAIYRDRNAMASIRDFERKGLGLGRGVEKSTQTYRGLVH